MLITTEEDNINREKNMRKRVNQSKTEKIAINKVNYLRKKQKEAIRASHREVFLDCGEYADELV